ncbi:MAG TPA: hypothetical protein VFT06_07280, partial [Flavisolibacter sp.]|nr:hypothetical protein [Flavisolibacter sp.]
MAEAIDPISNTLQVHLLDDAIKMRISKHSNKSVTRTSTYNRLLSRAGNSPAPLFCHAHFSL